MNVLTPLTALLAGSLFLSGGPAPVSAEFTGSGVLTKDGENKSFAKVRFKSEAKGGLTVTLGEGASSLCKGRWKAPQDGSMSLEIDSIDGEKAKGTGRLHMDDAGKATALNISATYKSLPYKIRFTVKSSAPLPDK